MQERQQLAQGPAEIDKQEQRFSNARQLLIDVMGLPDLQRVLGEEECLEVGRVYTQAPTLTLLMLQRLEGCLSLTAAVQQLLTHHRDLLTANCQVEEQTLSENNSALSKARQRLPLHRRIVLRSAGQSVIYFFEVRPMRLTRNEKPAKS